MLEKLRATTRKEKAKSGKVVDGGSEKMEPATMEESTNDKESGSGGRAMVSEQPAASTKQSW